MTRVLDFDDGFTSSTEPGEVQTPASEIQVTPGGNLSSTDAQSAFEELQGDIDDINASVGQANGIASLDSDGKIPLAQVPAIALTDVRVVADIAARDALTVEEGDVAKVTDAGGGITQTYIYDGSSWQVLQSDASLMAHEADTTNVHGIPDTSNLATKTGTETLTNKTLVSPKSDVIELDGQASTPATPSAGQYKAYVKDATKKLTILDENGTETTVGSGAGGIEFITNGDGEAGTTGFTEGSYSAAARPSGSFTASSGAGAFAISTTTSAPLSGNASLVLTKSSGASRQGRAVNYEFDLPLGYRAKVLDITANYIVLSGSFVAGSSSTDSSMIFYTEFYDGSTWTVAEPTSFKLLANSTTVSDLFHGNIQTPYDATKMRLIAYVAESADSAWAVKCELSVKPASYVYGTPITDWEAYTGTFTTNTGTMTNFTSSLKKRRVGDSLEITGSIVFTGAAGTWSQPRIPLPAGHAVDTTKLSTLTVGSSKGTASFLDAGTRVYQGRTEYNPSISSVIMRSSQVNTSAGAALDPVFDEDVSNTVPFTFASGDIINFDIPGIPIQGWSSSVQMSDSADTRVVAFRANSSSGAALAVVDTTYVYPTVQFDTHGAYNSSTGVYTVKVPGKYRVAAGIGAAQGTYAAGNLVKITIYKNGTLYSSRWTRIVDATNTTYSTGIEDVLDCVAGDTIDIRPVKTGTVVNSIGTSDPNYFSVERISGPSAIAASETIAARYTTTAGTNVVTGTTIVYGTKDYDTHGCYNSSTGVFTAPLAGLYRFKKAMNTQTATSSAVTNIVGSRLSIDGAAASTWLLIIRSLITSSVQKSGNGDTTVKLNAGQTVEIEGYNDTGSTHSLSTGAGENYLEVERIG